MHNPALRACGIDAQYIRVQVPVGVAAFPRDLLAFPPRSMVERGYNVAHWTTMPRGGHFAAFECPDLYVPDVRECFRPLREV